MNIQIPITLLPSLLFLAFCIIPTIVILWIFKRQTARKKSPLNMDLLRSPGESLRDRIQDMTYDIILHLTQIPIFSLLFYSIITTQLISSDGKINLITLLIYLITVVVSVSYLIVKVLKLMKQRNHLRLGYDCELGVGQELNNRMREGFHVFHDFPADGFNIDHVLVGSTGVVTLRALWHRSRVPVARSMHWLFWA